MERNFQEELLRELAELLEPLTNAARSDDSGVRLLSALGWHVDNIQGVSQADLNSAILDIARGVDLVRNAQAPNSLVELEEILKTTGEIIDAISAIAGLFTALPAQYAALQELPGDLLNLLLAERLEQGWPLLAALALVLGITRFETIGRSLVDPVTGLLSRRAVTLARIDLGQIPRLLRDPVAALKAEYHLEGGLTDSDGTADLLFPRVVRVLDALGVRACYGVPQDFADDTWGVDGKRLAEHALTVMVPLSVTHPDGLFGISLSLDAVLGLVLHPFGTLSFSEQTAAWDLKLESELGVEGFSIDGQGVELPPAVQDLTGRMSLTATKIAPARDDPSTPGTPPVVLVGSVVGTRLELGTLGFAAHVEFNADGFDYGALIEAEKAALVVSGGDGDGFVSKIIPGDIRIDFDLACGWSKRRGLYFRGGGGLEVSLPVNASIGDVVQIDAVLLGIIASSQEDRVKLYAGASVEARLGPVRALARGVGLEGDIAFANGNLGPADLRLMFRLPTTIGISIDAGPITGGGFLSFDQSNNQYDGALELKIYTVAVKAFGVIETKLPDGSEGFSFAIVISAEFTPIQLGLGFTLNGVGGVIGINRRIEEEGLRRAVRDGSLEHLLFPRDVIRDAPQIIHDLVAILPPVDGRYVFGPMAKIGWGTPIIIEAELGIILELPGPRLALLGEVHALLPKKDKGLVTLNLSVAGLLDFPKRYLSIDASLYDSRVGAYPITGDMAMRLLWGENPSFGLAVGGFNPGFQPPPAFPALRRVTVDLGVSGNPSLTLQGYFALTSNTAQVGAVAELRASGSGIRLYGRVQFDAIFVFSPFAFEAGISAQVRITFHGRGIGVHLRGVLTGPSPWRVRGKVCVSILWWDACLSFDKSFGSARRVELPAIDPWFGSQEVPGPEDVLGLLDALQDVRNWTPELPPGAFAVVSLAESANGPQPLDPLGVAVVRERVCPLNLQLQRFGSAKAAGLARFVLRAVTVNDRTVKLEDITYLKEPFAKAQFLQMTDAQKLSAPSFEPLDGGIRVPANDNAIAAGSVELNKIAYRTKVLGAPTFDEHLLPEEHLAGMKRRSATGLFGLRRAAAEAYVDPTAPARFIVGSELFVIGDQKTFKTREGILGAAASKIEATLALAQYLANHPEEQDDLQVFPKFEMGGR